MEDLKEQRKELAEAVYNSYSPEDFPGSKAWRITQSHQKQLNEFDTAHPEIIAQQTTEMNARNAKTAEEAGWI